MYMMAGSLFAINTEGYCTVTPSQRLVCVTHHVMLSILNHVQNIRERDCSFVSDLHLRSRQRFARNHDLPYNL